MQRFLLFRQLQMIREVFNKKFASFEENKESIVEKIKEMHLRITELQKKLGVKDDFILPQLEKHDVSGSSFASYFIKGRDASCSGSITRIMKARLLSKMKKFVFRKLV